jgi:hypothetical protein
MIWGSLDECSHSSGNVNPRQFNVLNLSSRAVLSYCQFQLQQAFKPSVPPTSTHGQRVGRPMHRIQSVPTLFYCQHHSTIHHLVLRHHSICSMALSMFNLTRPLRQLLFYKDPPCRALHVALFRFRNLPSRPLHVSLFRFRNLPSRPLHVSLFRFRNLPSRALHVAHVVLDRCLNLPCRPAIQD